MAYRDPCIHIRVGIAGVGIVGVGIAVRTHVHVYIGCVKPLHRHSLRDIDDFDIILFQIYWNIIMCVNNYFDTSQKQNDAVFCLLGLLSCNVTPQNF